MLNNIAFNDVSAEQVDSCGLGLVAENDLQNENDELPALLTIPRELVLSAAGIEEYAKENKEFRQLLDVAGHQVGRNLKSLIQESSS